MFPIEKAKTIYLSRVDKKHDGKGANCIFYKLTDNVGLKTYNDKRQRDIAFAQQKKYLSKGFAPKLGKKFCIKLNSTYNVRNKKYTYEDVVYCYITQNAKNIYKIKYAKIDKCLERMRKHKLYFNDPHKGNFGKIGNKIVPIDFDCEGHY